MPRESVSSWTEETVPVLRIADRDVALAWYERLGFTEEWTHRFTPTSPAFVSVRRGPDGAGVRLFLSEHTGDAVPGGSVYLRVDDVDPLAAEFGVEVEDAGPRREVRLADPDGNRILAGAVTDRPREDGYTFPSDGG
jgi:catechol 2,3-dioxygenase-like lactoylglutathione lyase family enzyme